MEIDHRHWACRPSVLRQQKTARVYVPVWMCKNNTLDGLSFKWGVVVSILRKKSAFRYSVSVQVALSLLL
jgi:hypothetical protein